MVTPIDKDGFLDRENAEKEEISVETDPDEKPS
jgi:hypothetical protein